MFSCNVSYIPAAQFVPAWWHGDGLTLSYSFCRAISGEKVTVRCKQLLLTPIFCFEEERKMDTLEILTKFYSNYDEEGRLLSKHGHV